MLVDKFLWECFGYLYLSLNPQTISNQMTKTLNLKRHVSMCIQTLEISKWWMDEFKKRCLNMQGVYENKSYQLGNPITRYGKG
jgi:hypothetical protein